MQPTAAQRVSVRRHQHAPTVGHTVSLRQHRQHKRLRRCLLTRAEVEISEQTGAVEKTGPDFKPLKDIQAIMDVLPHRYVLLSTAAAVCRPESSTLRADRASTRTVPVFLSWIMSADFPSF